MHRVDLCPRGEELVVQFRFDAALKDYVKSLPGSRFDWDSRTWRFRVDGAARVVDALVAKGFVLSPAVAALVNGGEAAPVAPVGAAAALSAAPLSAVPVGAAAALSASALSSAPPSAAPLSSAPADPTLSVRALNRTIGRAVAAAFPGEVWVAGVVQAWDRKAHDRHVFFTLLDADEAERTRVGVGGGGGGAAWGGSTTAAAIEAVLFATARDRIEAKLARESIQMADGLKVRVRGKVGVHEDRSRVRFVVEDIDARYSLGELALQRDEVVAALVREGLAERQRELPLPTPSLRVALVTSVGSDAYHDFLSGLRGSPYAFDVTPLDVRVQGPDLQPTVLAALRWAAAHESAFDVVVLTRGGGSRVDLAQWDNLDVARAVATHPLKCVVAIGHHQDVSALDRIAASCKTPTEAAAWLVAEVDALSARLDASARDLKRGTAAQLQQSRAAVLQLGRRMERAARRAAVGAADHVDRVLPRRLATAARQAVQRELHVVVKLTARLSSRRTRAEASSRRAAVETLRRRLDRAARERLRAAAASVAPVERRAGRAPATAMARAAARLATLDAALRAADPATALRRGFALVADAAGRPVTSARQAPIGARLALRFADGAVSATVDASIASRDASPLPNPAVAPDATPSSES